MQESFSELLKKCLPYKLFNQDGQALCRWLVIDEKNFTDPFFEETISAYMQEKANSSAIKCVSSLEVLPEWSSRIESIAPTAFIFHVSRCGSTLISQLLSLADENIVLSEVPFFDALLRDTTILPVNANRAEIVKAAIRFYGAKKQEKQSRVFIKTDSWHILYYSQLRAIYPTVPFILLYRDPVEVLRSQQRRRGMQAVPGLIDPSLFGFSKDTISTLTLDEYMVKILETYFEHFIDIASQDPLAFPVNYKEGALAIMEKIAGITSMPVDKEYISAMTKRAGYHAKYPGKVYQEEESEISPVAGCKKVMELYKKLETIRAFRGVQVKNEPVQSLGRLVN